MVDKLKFVLALLLVVAGIAGFYLLAEQALVAPDFSLEHALDADAPDPGAIHGNQA